MKRLGYNWTVKSFTGIGKSKVSVTIEKKAELCFIEELKEIIEKDDSYLVIFQEDVASDAELLNEYYLQFKFPYFGFNWDALLDCLGDLDWINQKDIIIFHQEFPKLAERDLKIYIEILLELISRWNKYESHNFDVYFQLKDYSIIKGILKI
jgi:hypothetical protein